MFRQAGLFVWDNMEKYIRCRSMQLCISFYIFAEKRKNGKLETKENNP